MQEYHVRDEAAAASTDGAPPIPFFRPSLPPLEEYTRLLEEIWATRMLSNFADFSKRLEALTSDYLGARHTRVVVSGDIGLVVTLSSLELPPGSPCWVSDFTFNSTINAPIWAGLEPVIVDADPDTFNMSVGALADAMASDGRQGVVLATHVFGNPCDHVALRAVADTTGSFLVFDAAHGYGSRRGDEPVGRLGDAEVFSLSGTKLVTSAEGGLIATPHDWLAERIAYRRAYGFQHDYVSQVVGLNGKMSELHCALGLLSLATVEEAIAKRHQIVEGYRRHLDTSIKLQSVRREDRSTYKDVCLLLGSARPEIEADLAAARIGCKRYFVPLHSMPAYLRFASGRYPVAERLHDETLCVPAYGDMDEAVVSRISEVVNAAYARMR